MAERITVEVEKDELVELVEDLKECEAQLEDLEERREGIKELIRPYVQPYGEESTVSCNGRLFAWHEPTTTERLDRGKLVAAGVTPEQLKKGTVKGTKKGYMDVRKPHE